MGSRGRSQAPGGAAGGDPTNCPFCAMLDSPDLLAENSLAFALPDAFPVSPGHALILPRRHVADYFDLTAEEKAAVWELVDRVRGAGSCWGNAAGAAAADSAGELRGLPQPGGFNIGVNVGEAAGQTVFHVHVHLIPRYAGDREDPRGGVRWVLPERARYWEGG